MCCDGHDDGHDLPHIVAQMLATYDTMHEGVSFDWGREDIEIFAYGRHAPFPALLRELVRRAQLGEPVSLDDCLWSFVGQQPPLGLVAVDIGDDGPSVRRGPLPRVLPGTPRSTAMLLHSRITGALKVVVADREVILDGGRSHLMEVTGSDCAVEVLGRTVTIVTEEHASPSVLRVRSTEICRWSVIDDRGGAWFPDGALEKWDYHGRPWFHAASAELAVPSGTLTVRAARGLEFTVATTTVDCRPGAEQLVELEPLRRFDPAGIGWFGGDLHVHLNYSGDHVARPEHAAAAQRAEGLHLLNLVAGNLATSLVYDREAFEHYAGQDLPWSDDLHVARWGVEYRNDLLGHVHALNPSGPPSQYASGHPRSDHPDDWPPNATACEELRGLGATVGYTHPVASPLGASPSPVFTGRLRSTEARELVADAALGLVDSMDLLGPQAPAGAVALYHRLLNTGIRLSATVGTDTMLSMAHCHTFSNPPGWARVYADLGDAPLTVAAWQDAVRGGRTMVTNGPWVVLDVDGAGPGTVLDRAAGSTLVATAHCVGAEARAVRIIGPDGVIAEAAVLDGGGSVTASIDVTEPIWLAADVVGDAHPDVLCADVYAHTSPVHVEVSGRRIARAADAAWCLEWLDMLEAIVRQHGQYSADGQLADVLDVIDRARSFYGPIESQAVLP